MTSLILYFRKINLARLSGMKRTGRKKKKKTGGMETGLDVTAIIQGKGNETVNEGATLRTEKQ